MQVVGSGQCCRLTTQSAGSNNIALEFADQHVVQACGGKLLVHVGEDGSELLWKWENSTSKSNAKSFGLNWWFQA